MCAFSNNLPHFSTKLPQKRPKMPQNHKTVPNLANKVDIPPFWHELIILRGIQPLFGGNWLKNCLKRCYFTKTTTSGSKTVKSRSCIFAAIILRGICTTF